MGKQLRIMLVGLESFLGIVHQLFDHEENVVFEVADNVEEALDMVEVTGADLIAVDRSLEGIEPVEVVAKTKARLGEAVIPFLFLAPGEMDKAVIVRQRPGSDKLSLIQPGKVNLAAALRQATRPPVLSKTPPSARKSFREQLALIGCEEKVQVGQQAFFVQTEVHPQKEGATLRTTIFEQGRILESRSEKVPGGLKNAARIREQAEQFHARVVASLAPKRV